MTISDRMRALRATALAGVLAVAAVPTFATLPAAAASAIPTGTTIVGRINTDLDSGKVNVGDHFSLALERPYPNGDIQYAGGYVRGHVASVQRAGQGRKAQIGLSFDSIVLANGASAPVSGHVVAVDQHQKSAILQQAAGAGVGMIVGNILGKTLLHTNLGGLAGAAGGFVYANNLKTNFVIPKDSVVKLQTDRTVPRPQAHR